MTIDLSKPNPPPSHFALLPRPQGMYVFQALKNKRALYEAIVSSLVRHDFDLFKVGTLQFMTSLLFIFFARKLPLLARYEVFSALEVETELNFF